MRRGRRQSPECCVTTTLDQRAKARFQRRLLISNNNVVTPGAREIGYCWIYSSTTAERRLVAVLWSLPPPLAAVAAMARIMNRCMSGRSGKRRGAGGRSLWVWHGRA